ncbi:tripartite tricarboxylate transporter substrate binding protein [Roseomonas sp. KE2513]|uniref:tripartite tricarboxylate transporter substrate binding protein n=1 Tax=Roseomonas sp. KE2513 TaxID=2479202 RepID=UPI0018DF6B05|nr:tripartite tricarboxylate transporter substrate binding protein [Roseomonas sp. KE2513]MBI0538580.1 tripartite tricarboxylate transporter substrate binding protein [Roseomonas sp. KE2513]
MPRDRLTRRAALALPAILLAAKARAQGWPERAVTLVVPFPAAGTADLVARLLAPELSRAFGRPFVVDNRPGANGTLGTDLVVRAQADGHTLLLGASPTHTINPHLYRRMPHDPLRDTAPVALAAEAPNVIVVHPSLGVNSLGGLIAAAKARPSSIAYASGGNGSSGHLAMELLKTVAGIDMLHVPYPGGPAALNDLLAGRVAVMAFTAPSVMPHAEAGRLRALAVTGAARSPLAPELPTVAESGFPGYEAVAWFGLFGPAALPEPIAARLSAAMAEALADARVRDALARAGAEARHLPPAAFADFLREDSARWARVVEAFGARVD